MIEKTKKGQTKCSKHLVWPLTSHSDSIHICYRQTANQQRAGTSADASKRILDIIKEGKLSAGQVSLIAQAIKEGFTADELEYLYSLTMDSDQMTREFDRIRKEKTDGKG